MGRLSLVGALFVSACFRPDFDHPTCGPAGECPPGLFCGAQLICSGVTDAQSSDMSPTTPVPKQSCIDLPTTCGPNGSDSCCNSPDVVGGVYHRSYDVAGDANSGTPAYLATVSTFRLDKYEVTVGRFRAFVNAKMGTQASSPIPGTGQHRNLPGSGWELAWNANLAADTTALLVAVKCYPSLQTWTDMPGDNEGRPMNCISWYEAMAFCTWDGGYLPTEAEWNYAATGGEQQRAYPWSSVAAPLELDTSRASYFDATCSGDGMPGCTVADLLRVGSKPAGDGRWGQSDLAGNVFEWTLDSFAGYVSPCTDCADLTVAPNRVARGGSFADDATYLRTADRRYQYPAASRNVVLGVRCARSAP